MDDLDLCLQDLEASFAIEVDGEGSGYANFHCAMAEAGAAGGSRSAWLLRLERVAFGRRRR